MPGEGSPPVPGAAMPRSAGHRGGGRRGGVGGDGPPSTRVRSSPARAGGPPAAAPAGRAPRRGRRTAGRECSSRPPWVVPPRGRPPPPDGGPVPAARGRSPSRSSRRPGRRSSARAAVARAPASAVPMPAPPSEVVPAPGTPAPVVTCSNDCRVSHSEAKPFSGGSPAMAMAPMRKAPAVQGMRRSSPPRRSRSRPWTARSNDPAPRNSNPLKTAWLSVCRRAAANASSAHVVSPRSRNSSDAPRPSTMMPTFSMEWKASRRLSSCWKRA